MSTPLMAILIVAATIILPWLFIALHKKSIKKKEQENFRRFSTAGTERELAFTRQEVIQNMIVGLDGIRQVLMIAELDNEFDIACVDIKELSKCFITKEYHIVGDTPGDKEKVLKEIRLVFDFKDNRLPIYILFYNHTEDSIYVMTDMENKAKEWQMLISKLIPKLVSARP